MYTPRLIVGVSHSSKNIQRVIDVLESRICEGVVVGTEAYTYPISGTTYFDQDDVLFFNAIGDYVVSRGGYYLPLQDVETLERLKRVEQEYKPEFMIAFRKMVEKIREYVDENASYDFAFTRTHGELASPLEIMMCRMMDRVLRKHGEEEYHYLRDDLFLSLADKLRPEIVVLGSNHAPAFLVQYPNTDFVLVH